MRLFWHERRPAWWLVIGGLTLYGLLLLAHSLRAEPVPPPPAESALSLAKDPLLYALGVVLAGFVWLWRNLERSLGRDKTPGAAESLHSKLGDLKEQNAQLVEILRDNRRDIRDLRTEVNQHAMEDSDKFKRIQDWMDDRPCPPGGGR